MVHLRCAREHITFSDDRPAAATALHEAVELIAKYGPITLCIDRGSEGLGVCYVSAVVESEEGTAP